jgi:threonine dehydratase
MDAPPLLPPTSEAAARAAVARLCRRTPLLAAPALGDGVLAKLECLQRTRSFKLRGAAAALAVRFGERPQDTGAAGMAPAVCAASAGNHGLGVAVAASTLGLRALVVVPETTPAVKRSAIAAAGAEVRVAGAGYDAAEAEARALAAESGAEFLSPYDDDAVIFGNGVTVGEEIRTACPEVRQVVAPVGGGGLLAGLAAALGPAGVELWGVQPAANCAMAESLRAGRALTRYEGEATICEGLEGAVAERTFARVRDSGARLVLAEEGEIGDAVAFAYRKFGWVLEPSAAVTVAALRAARIPLRPPCVVVLTGGNVDPEWLSAVLRAAPRRRARSGGKSGVRS